MHRKREHPTYIQMCQPRIKQIFIWFSFLLCVCGLLGVFPTFAFFIITAIPLTRTRDFFAAHFFFEPKLGTIWWFSVLIRDRLIKRPYLNWFDVFDSIWCSKARLATEMCMDAVDDDWVKAVRHVHLLGSHHPVTLIITLFKICLCCRVIVTFFNFIHFLLPGVAFFIANMSSFFCWFIQFYRQHKNKKTVEYAYRKPNNKLSSIFWHSLKWYVRFLFEARFFLILFMFVMVKRRQSHKQCTRNPKTFTLIWQSYDPIQPVTDTIVFCTNSFWTNLSSLTCFPKWIAQTEWLDDNVKCQSIAAVDIFFV